MLVRLLTEQNGSQLSRLQLLPDGLELIWGMDENIFLPMNQIRNFQTEGRGSALKRFVLETDSHLYEGVFLEEGDASLVIRFFQEHLPCYTEIRLESE